MRSSWFLVLALLVVTSGCATRTPYGPYGDKGGYVDDVIDQRVRAIEFSGNALTHIEYVDMFVIARAVEVCESQNGSMPRLIGREDLSRSQTVQKTSNYSYTTPVQVYGQSNTNSQVNYFGGNQFGVNSQTNYNATVTGGNQFGGSETWNETYVYPRVRSYYFCTNHIHQIQAELQPVSADDMKPYVKDLMTAVQIKNIGADSINRETLKNGDIIVKVNGERIRNNQELMFALESATDLNSIRINLVREGKSKSVIAKAFDATEQAVSQVKGWKQGFCKDPEVGKRPMCAGYARTPASRQYP